jgi:hypothetical protein
MITITHTCEKLFELENAYIEKIVCIEKLLVLGKIVHIEI